MKIHEIDHDCAQVLVPHRDPILQFFAVEKAWYASEDDRLLGTVLFHRCSNDWGFVVLGTNQRGCYQWIAGDVKLATQHEAEERMREEMEKIAQTGQVVFERPVKRFFQDMRELARMRRARRMARRAQRQALRAGSRAYSI